MLSLSPRPQCVAPRVLYTLQDLWVTSLVSFKVSQWLLLRLSYNHNKNHKGQDTLLVPKEEPGPRWVPPGISSQQHHRPAPNSSYKYLSCFLTFSIHRKETLTRRGVVCSVYKGGQSYSTPDCSPPLILCPILRPFLFHRSSCEITIICGRVIRESSLMRFKMGFNI